MGRGTTKFEIHWSIGLISELAQTKATSEQKGVRARVRPK